MRVSTPRSEKESHKKGQEPNKARQTGRNSKQNINTKEKI